MSLAAWIPSSLSAFSITLLRSRACRSSALIEQPIVPFGVRVFTCKTGRDYSSRVPAAVMSADTPVASTQLRQPTADRSTHDRSTSSVVAESTASPTDRLQSDTPSYRRNSGHRNPANILRHRPTAIMLIAHQICVERAYTSCSSAAAAAGNSGGRMRNRLRAGGAECESVQLWTQIRRHLGWNEH